MTVIQKTIGRLPVNLGDYNSTRAYGKKNRVLLYGCEWESKVNNNTYAPAALNTTTGVITPDTTHWMLISGSYNTWLIDNGYQKMAASNVKDSNLNDTQDNINANIVGEIGSDSSENTIKGRIKSLENNVGSGGSVDQRIAAAKNEVIGGATSGGNTLKKIEDRVSPLETAVGTGGSVDERIAAEGALHYLKSETYNKTEVNGLVSTPHQEYVTVSTYASLPASGSEDTIYRVSNYDGTQVAAGVYSEYAWDGTQYVFLCAKSSVGEVFDISEYNSGATYADLSAALGVDGANVPADVRKGGMSVKYVQSSDNDYVQYRSIKNRFSTDVNDWRKDCDAVLQDRIESFSKLTSMSVNTDVIDTFVASNEQVATLKNNIVLSKDGDSIEFFVKSCLYPSSDNKHNAFARNPVHQSHIAIGLANNYISARADDGTWVLDKIVDTVGKFIKISYENGNIVLFVDGVVGFTYTGQKQITISSFGNGSSYGYWEGSIENLTINGVLVSLKDLCQIFTASESITAHKFTSDELSDIADIPKIKSDVVELNEKLENLEQPERYIFDSLQESYISLTTPLVLSQNGDSLEFRIDYVPQYHGGDVNKAYALGYNPNNAQRIALGMSISVIGVRADDSTWLCDIAEQNSLSNGDVIKISYEDGNVVTKKNGITIATYTGQKTLTISSFGDGSKGSGNYGYWDGTISNIKVNGNDYVLGGTNHNVIIEDVSASIPQMLIEKNASVITLYILYKGYQYIGYPINYRYKAFTADEYPSFYDNWGVGRIFLANYDKDNNSMSVNQYLFSTGEAELAVETPNVKYGETGQSQYKFSGGVAHGFENIVTEGGTRKFMLLINNISYAESSVIPLTAISSFDLYTQTQIYQAYTNENPYGLVDKHWFVKDGLLQIRTTMKMLRSIYLNQSEFGMFCIYRRAGGDDNTPYLTNRAIENDDIFKAYDVSDGWESDSANNKLKTSNYKATEMILYGQKGMGFSMKIVDANTIAPASGGQNGGGMSMATNGGNPYNKVYFDLTGHYTPNVDDELYATQVWSIK